MEEQELYAAIMAFARKWGFTFDEAIETIVHAQELMKAQYGEEMEANGNE